MNSEEKSTASEKSSPNFSKALPAFDLAMKKIVATPKSEVDRREKAERDAKDDKK